MIPVIFIMGATCSGKGTFCQYAKKELGKDLATFSIGDEMRRRHPDPDYFKGKAALEETQDEVEQIFKEQFEASLASKARIIIVDGQPRLPRAVDYIFKFKNAFLDYRFVLLHASAEARKRRINERHKIDPADQEQYNYLESKLLEMGSTEQLKRADLFMKLSPIWKARELAEARLQGDNILLYDVWAHLTLRDQLVTVVNSDGPVETYQPQLLRMLCGAIQ